MIQYRMLQPNEFDAWVDHCTFIFNNGVIDPQARQSFAQYFRHRLDDRLEYIRVAVEDGRILSGLCIFPFEMYLAGETVRMGGLGCVSTQPDARGRGLSTHLLNEAIALMQAWDMPVSLLGTGIFPFYARLGWQQVAFSQRIVAVDRSIDTHGITVRPMDFDRDLDTVAAIYNQTSRGYHGPLARSMHYWQTAMRAAAHWWVSELPGIGTAIACMRVSESEDHNQAIVEEFTCLPEHARVFDPMLVDVLRQMGLASPTAACPPNAISAFPQQGSLPVDFLMARLIQPVTAGGHSLATTAQLVDALQAPDAQGQSRFLFWGTDGF